jgi:hypothetical protein
VKGTHRSRQVGINTKPKETTPGKQQRKLCERSRGRREEQHKTTRQDTKKTTTITRIRATRHVFCVF